MLILDKVYFRAKKISKDKGVQGTLHKEETVSPAGIHNNPKYIYTKQHNLKIPEAKIDTLSEYSYNI